MATYMWRTREAGGSRGLTTLLAAPGRRCRVPYAVGRATRRHGLHTGAATSAGLEDYATRISCVVPRRRIRLAGLQWTLPSLVCGGGGDAHGLSGLDRGALLVSSVLRRGCNAACFDADDLVDRYGTGSVSREHDTGALAAVPALHAANARWEAHALARLLQTTDANDATADAAGTYPLSGVRREHLALMATVKLTADAQGAWSATQAVAVAADRVAAACQHLDIACFDLVFLELPPPPGGARGSAEQAAVVDGAALMAAAQSALVQRGLTQRVGLALPAVSGAGSGSGSGSGSSGEAGDDSAYAELAAVLRGAAAARAHAGAGLIAAVALPVNLLQSRLLWAAPDDAGTAVAQLAASLAAHGGLPLFARRPLDCVVGGRPFRCTDVTVAAGPAVASGSERLVTPSNALAASGVPSGAPSRPPTSSVLPGLNASLNEAIHCEVAWERRVRRAVQDAEAARAGQLAVVLPAAPTGNRQSELAVGDAASSALPALPLAALQPRDTAWARLLAANLARLAGSLVEWRWTKYDRIIPAIERLTAVCRVDADATSWASAYRALLMDAAARVDALAEAAHADAAADVATELGVALAGDGTTSGSVPPPLPLRHLHQSVLQLMLPKEAAAESELRQGVTVAAAMTEVGEAFTVGDPQPPQAAGQRPHTVLSTAAQLPAPVAAAALRGLTLRGRLPALMLPGGAGNGTGTGKAGDGPAPSGAAAGPR
jgi:hypothetical protein